MTRAHICAQESEGRAKSESAKERMNYNIPHSRACTHPHARAFLRERTGRIAATTCACTRTRWRSVSSSSRPRHRRE